MNGTCVAPTWPDGGDLDLACAPTLACIAPSVCVPYFGTDTQEYVCRTPDGGACSSTNDDCTAPFNGDATSCCASGPCTDGACLCVADAAPCTPGETCCGAEVCDTDSSSPSCCAPTGTDCSTGQTCCSPDSCVNGTCSSPSWPDGGEVGAPCSTIAGCDSDLVCQSPTLPDAGSALACFIEPGEPCATAGTVCANWQARTPAGSCCSSGLCSPNGTCE